MKTSSNSKEPKKQTPKQRRETLEERVHRHLNDINSKITDDDIRNVVTEMEIRSQRPITQPANTSENKKRNRTRANKKKQNKPTAADQITPWDILNED